MVVYAVVPRSAPIWASGAQEVRVLNMAVSAQDSFVEGARQHGQGIVEGDAPLANKAHKKIMLALKGIKETPDRGESFFLTLLENEDVSVVKWAALYLLPSRREEAERALQKIAESASPMIAFGAEMTLKEWRAGRLKID